jgi:hypothetical protein
MTAISDLNIVVQQSGAKDSHTARHPTHEQSQVVENQQKEKDAEQRTTIQQSEHPEGVGVEKTSFDDKKRKRKKNPRQKKEALSQNRRPESSGKLVNTVA